MSHEAKTHEDFRQLVGAREDIDRKPVEIKEHSYSGMTVLKIRYPVHKGYWEEDVGSAYILVPLEKNGKLVYVAHQHGGTWLLGKDQTAGHGVLRSGIRKYKFKGTENQIYGLELAQEGNIVISSDAPTFGDRCYPRTLPSAYGFEPGKLSRKLPKGNDFWLNCNIERQLHEYAIARGQNLAAYLFEGDSGAITAAQHVLGEELNNIGVIGHSMGGERAFLLAMLDSRVKTGVANCGLISVGKYQTMDTFTKDGKPEGRIFHNFALAIPGLVSQGLDYHESIELMPEDTQFLMIYNADDRIFPIEAVEPVVNNPRHLKNIASLKMGGGHDFPESNRGWAYGFLKNPRTVFM